MLRQLTDIRRGERARTALAFAVLLLVVGSYTIVKAAREAVFLSRFSVTQLSVLALGLAVLSGTVVSIYLRVTSTIARHRLIVGSYGVVALSIGSIAIGLHDHDQPGWLPWLLYVWSSVFGVFIVTQFWLLASDLFDVREAKRLFGIVGMGAIAGGLSGGVVTRMLASRIGVSGLLSIAAAMLLTAGVATRALWRLRLAEPRAVTRSIERPGLWDLVKQPSYVRLLAGGLVLATVVTTLLDWQLKTVAKHALENRTEALAAFFGSVYAYMSAGSLVLQIVVTSWLLRNYGVGVARAVLPVALLLGFSAVVGNAVLPVSLLAVLTGARLLEGGVRFAVNQPAVELSWLPLPSHEREVGRSLADTVGDRVGTGLAGVAWIGFAALSLDGPERVHWVGLIGIALTLAWLLVLRKTQASYVGEMRSALAQRAIDLESLWRSIGHEQTKKTIVEAIESGDPGRIAFSLYLLEGWEEELPDLGVALRHARPDVRLQALRLLAEKSGTGQRALALPCLQHPDLEVREAAVVYLRRTAPSGPDPLLTHLPPGDLPAEFIRWLIEKTGPSAADSTAASVATSIAAAPHESRIAMIRLLGAAPADSTAPLLNALIGDPDERVVEAAIRSIGRARVVSLVPALAEKLTKRRWRALTIGALADIGTPALVQLAPLFRDETSPVEVRLAVVRLAGASRNETMVSELMLLLDDPSVELSREALRALARLRNHVPITFGTNEIRPRLLAEATALYRDLLFLDKGAWPQARAGDAGEEFLQRSIRDAANARVDRIFRLLSLIHSPVDVHSAYRGLKSPIKSTRSKSIEFLDNLLDSEVKRVVLPTLEDADSGRLTTIAKRNFGILGDLPDQMVERLLAEKDPWLRQVAAWTTAKKKENEMGLSLVEKALKLRNVDVLARVSSEELAYIAKIAEEIELDPDTPIYGHGDAPDALYVIVSGNVRLFQDAVEIGLLGAGEAFGSWALFDEAPRVASAAAAGPATVLKVDREEFLELLGDRVDLARAIFKAMVERIRSLAELAQ